MHLSSEALWGLVAALAIERQRPWPASAVDLTSSITRWSNASEMAALNVLKNGLAKNTGNTGPRLADPARDRRQVAADQPDRPAATRRTLFMAADPGIYRDLAKQGKAMDLTQLFDRQPAPPRLPASRAQGDHRRRQDHEGADRARTSTAWSTTTWTWPRRPASIRPSGRRSTTCGPISTRSKAAGFIPLAIGGHTSRPATFHALLAPMPAPTSSTASTAPTARQDACSTIRALKDSDRLRPQDSADRPMPAR